MVYSMMALWEGGVLLLDLLDRLMTYRGGGMTGSCAAWVASWQRTATIGKFFSD